MIKIISTTDGVYKGLANTFRKSFSIPQKLITNTDVKTNYINSLSNYIDGNNIKNIIKLINKGKIVPVSCTSKFIESLNKNLKGDACMNPKEYENVLGFYTGKQNRLYILMDNVSRLSTNNKGLIDVTIHELQHMYCYNFTPQFINLWSKQLYKFYAYFCAYIYKSYTSGFKTLWNKISSKDQKVIKNLLDPNNGIEYYVKYLIYNHEYLYCCAGSNVSLSDCKSIGQKMGMMLSNNGCEQQTSEIIANRISNISKDIFTGDIGRTYNNKDNGIIISCLREAYKSTFNKDPWDNGSFIYQEIIFPSEVISITSQYNYKNNNYYKFLGSL